MNKTTEALKLAEEALYAELESDTYEEFAEAAEKCHKALAAIREALAEPDMKDAIIAGNEVLLNEQAWLLRECRGALDSLIKQRPNMAGLLCGSTTLGNLRAELGAYRPSGVMNGTK